MYFAAILSILSALSSTSLAQNIDPNTIDIGVRSQWCTAQKTSCPLLCLQYPGNDASTTSNDCDPETLDFSCVCAVNGMSPNASQFSQTIPYFECTEFNNECVKNCGSDNTCSDACRADHPCGAQDPKRVNTSTITTHPKTTATNSDGSAATDTAAATTFDSSAATGGTGSGGVSGNGAAPGHGLAISVGRAYGLAIVLGSVFAGFVLVL